MKITVSATLFSYPLLTEGRSFATQLHNNPTNIIQGKAMKCSIVKPLVFPGMLTDPYEKKDNYNEQPDYYAALAYDVNRDGVQMGKSFYGKRNGQELEEVLEYDPQNRFNVKLICSLA